MQPNYGPIQTQAMPNQQVPPPQQQQQYSIPTGAPQPTQMYQTQPTQHQPVVRFFDLSSERYFDF
jgi:hypothetical protein